MNTTNKQEQMWESLRDPEFRKQLIDEHINVGIPFQIRALRDRQQLTQTRLAELLGSKRKQPLISQWEDPNYGKYTLETLKDLAKAFDVGLLVRFVPFSTLIDWTINLTSDVIAPPSFGEEEQYRIPALVTPSRDLKAVDANSMFDFVNKLVPGTFPSSATTNVKEFVHA